MFTVLAINFNTEGVLSSEKLLYACMAPSEGIAPTRVTSTIDSMTVAWQTPSSDGGCQILGYAVFVDDGEQGDFTEVNSDQDSLVRNDPGLH